MTTQRVALLQTSEQVMKSLRMSVFPPIQRKKEAHDRELFVLFLCKSCIDEHHQFKPHIAFRDTVPALSVYFKRSFNEKLESYTKPTVTSPNFQRTTYHFLQERKIPKGHAR